MLHCPAGSEGIHADTDSRHGQPTRTADTDSRHGQPTRTADTDSRHGQPTRTADTDSRHGQPTRTADTDSRHGQPTRTASALVTAVLSLAACVHPEPDFRPAALIEEAEAAPPAAERDGPPNREALIAAGLQGTLSEGRPPPPFVPDEAHYPPVPAGGNLDVALRAGTPRLVEALRVDDEDGVSVLTAREEGPGGANLIVVLPEGYRCSTTASVVAGHRYVLITGPRDERGRYTIHMGLGAEHSVMLVDEGGAVETPLGSRDAEALVAEARRSA